MPKVLIKTKEDSRYTIIQGVPIYGPRVDFFCTRDIKTKSRNMIRPIRCKTTTKSFSKTSRQTGNYRFSSVNWNYCFLPIYQRACTTGNLRMYASAAITYKILVRGWSFTFKYSDIWHFTTFYNRCKSQKFKFRRGSPCSLEAMHF